jgi:hypothetical protein
VRRLRGAAAPDARVIIETRPGEECQVDYGTGPMVRDPDRNGNAERFIHTALRDWAYARTYQNSALTVEQLEYWLHDCAHMPASTGTRILPAPV